MGGSKGGSPNIPKPPPIGKSYQQGIDVYLKNLPRELQTEQATRAQYDPQRIAQQQGLQAQYGPTQYAQQLQALHQLDPQWINEHSQMYQRVANDLNAGTSLTPGQTTQLEQQVRGAQAARGNIYGDAPAIAEAYTLGDRGQQLYQQRIQNAQNFLQSPTVPMQLSSVSPVSPDRNFSYVDPNAGFQGINANNALYQGQVGAAAANSGGGGGWGSTLQTVGQVAGLVAMFASDRRLKKDIHKVGEGKNGAGLYSFAYKGHTGKDVPHYVGYMANEVEKSDPDHVAVDPVTGYKAVSEKYAPVQVS